MSMLDNLRSWLSWHYWSEGGGAALFTGLGAAADDLAEQLRAALRQRFPSRAAVDALGEVAYDRNLQPSRRLSEQQLRAYLQDAWRLWRYAGTRGRLLEELALLGYTASIVSWRDLADAGYPDAFGRDSSCYFVVLQAPNRFTAAVAVWDGSTDYGDGTLWGLGSGTSTDVLDLQRALTKWEPAAASCRFIAIGLDAAQPVVGATLLTTDRSIGGMVATCFGVWRAGREDVWVVAAGGVIQHWTGASWTETTQGSEDLRAIAGDLLGGIYVVGNASTGLYLAPPVAGVYGSWIPLALPAASSMRGVWASSPEYIWACGNGGVLYAYDGISWATVTTGIVENLRAVWGVAGGAVWVVGESGTILRVSLALGVYNVDDLSTGTEDLLGVWGSGPDDVWIVGTAGTVLRWDGATLSAVTSGVMTDLRAVAGVSADEVWVVGAAGARRWTGAAFAALSGAINANAISITPGSRDVWAAGPAGAVRRWAAGIGGAVQIVPVRKDWEDSDYFNYGYDRRVT